VLLALPILAGAAALLAQEGAGVPDPVAGQEAPPSFAGRVEQVIVDLVVTDKDGKPVSGITADDLTIEEDGVPQEIISFEAVQLPSGPAALDEPAESGEPLVEPPPLPRISTNAEVEARPGRTFVVILDDMNLTPFRARDAKAAIVSFLRNGVRDGDYVTLLATSGSAWWTARMVAGRDQLIDTLKRLEGRRIPDLTMERITDWEALRIHVYADPKVTAQVLRRFERFGVAALAQAAPNEPLSGTVADPIVSTRAAEVYYESTARSNAALGTIERALNGLASAGGRKSVILVSEGFIYDPNLEGFKRVRAAARRANAAIYFLNARGLEGLPVEFSAVFGPSMPSQDVGYAFTSDNLADEGSEVLADDSGGFTVRNTNDLSRGIQRIVQESQHYYLLGYISSNAARDGTYRKIEVELKPGRGRDLKIRARRGYYAPNPDGSLPGGGRQGVDAEMQAALDSPWSVDDIPLRMTHYVGVEQTLGKANVVVVAEVGIGDLSFTEVEGRERAEIGFLLVVAHRESGEFFRYEQGITMRLRPSTRERLKRIGFPILRDFELQPGEHQAKIIVREPATGRMGSVVHEFEVPALDGFRVTTPILTDTFGETEPGLPGNPQPLARREFFEGERLLCQFEVFGAEKDDSGLPQVAQGYRVLGPDGTVFTSHPARVILPTSIGALSRTFGFSLENATPGDYELIMTFRDQLAGKTLELRDPFRVLPAPSPESPTPAS
jgi:VWFA-related protein